MPDYSLEWATAGSNGAFEFGSGAGTVGVGITTNYTDKLQSAAVASTGTPSQNGLWVAGIEDPVTTQMIFDTPVENLSFEIFNIDQFTGLWDDRITIIAIDANGAQVPVTFSNLDGLHTISSGTVVDADGYASSGVETTGAADSVTVDIAGPIQSLTIIFDVGESATETGTFGISDIGFDAAPVPDDAILGTSGDDTIDVNYLDDPQGDQVTTGDDTIYAGDGADSIKAEAGNDLIFGQDGNDTVFAGTGHDTIFGQDGEDSVEMGAGNDVFFGGDGDDWVNGDLGNDVLIGGKGNDFLRGSYGEDTIHSGGAGEGDDFLWGGYRDDLFIFSNNFGNDTVEGEEVDETHGDTMDLSGITDNLTHDLTHLSSDIGSFTDGADTAIYEGIENIILGSGADTLVLADGSGNDRVLGFSGPTDNGDGTFTGHDMLDVSLVTRDYGTTPISTRNVAVSADADGNAVLSFPYGDSLTLVGIDPTDISSPAALEAIGIPAASDGIVSGSSGNDFIWSGYTGDTDGDMIDNLDYGPAEAPNNVDIIHAGGGDDLIFSGNDADKVYADDGEDVVFAGKGDDVVYGGKDNDNLFGEDNNDTLHGGDDDDTLTGGDGADVLYGGADRDLFVGGSDGDQVHGGEAGDDFDTLDLTGKGPLRVHYNPSDSEAGTIDFLDGSGAVTGTMSFDGIEKVIPCFTPGTLIGTIHGERPVEDLKVGDQILTRDGGFQEIRWFGKRTLNNLRQKQNMRHQPVLIQKGALGNASPERDMMVSPNHRVLMTGVTARFYFGESEVLVAAKHLVGMQGIFKAKRDSISYLHFMFDQHEIVHSNQLWTESFQPGAYTLNGLEEDQRSEILALFPELVNKTSKESYKAARLVLNKREAMLITR